MPKVFLREEGKEMEFETINEMLICSRSKFIEQQMSGKVVIHEEDREYVQSRQAKVKYYLQPLVFRDTPLRDFMIFKNEIRSHSGKHRHQGGVVIFCLEGKGYSVVDGKRYDWGKGDLILLPYKPGGVEHQHFNLDPGKACEWIAFIYLPYWDLLAGDYEQKEVHPDYGKK